jgi:hypothetical protein
MFMAIAIVVAMKNRRLPSGPSSRSCGSRSGPGILVLATMLRT